MLGPLTAIAAVGILSLAGCGGDLTTSAHKPTRAERAAKRKHERAVYLAVCVTNGGAEGDVSRSTPQRAHSALAVQ